MRVVVVGASGNVGTGVLRALANEEAVTSVLGIARRPPPADGTPYDTATWIGLDLRAADAQERLNELLSGADAVIHLAWQIQPNRDRDRLREVNVEGTRKVAWAAGRASVPHLIVASSWAAYSPADDKQPQDETWPTRGVSSSHYSVDKSAQERVLDEFEHAYPDVAVARVRMALVFQRDAGAEIARYFVGPFIPRTLLRPGSVPLLPWPPGLRLQVVHADDAGAAYALVLRRRASGAFNLAAPPVLTGADVSAAIGAGRVVPTPARALRAVLALAYRGRLVPVDPGWIDMATALPLMDTSRITALGWQPEHDAHHTLREMVQGLYSRSGAESPVMRVGQTRLEPIEDAGVPRRTGPQITGALQVPDHLDAGLLELYLADHLSGATAGLNRIESMSRSYANTELSPGLDLLREQITAERNVLLEIIGSLGLRRRSLRQGLAWAAERLGRLKLNRRVVRTSAMTPLLELELMHSAVAGKVGGWLVLDEYGEDLGLGAGMTTELVERAERQLATLRELHETVRRTALRTDRATEGA